MLQTAHRIAGAHESRPDHHAPLLLLPGTCFAMVGLMVITDPSGLGRGLFALLISAALLAVVAWMARVVIRCPAAARNLYRAMGCGALRGSPHKPILA